MTRTTPEKPFTCPFAKTSPICKSTCLPTSLFHLHSVSTISLQTISLPAKTRKDLRLKTPLPHAFSKTFRYLLRNIRTFSLKHHGVFLKIPRSFSPPFVLSTLATRPSERGLRSHLLRISFQMNKKEESGGYRKQGFPYIMTTGSRKQEHSVTLHSHNATPLNRTLPPFYDYRKRGRNCPSFHSSE